MRAAFRHSLATALLATTSLAAVSAMAQDQASPAEPPQEQAQAAPDTSGYGDIIVTAQKRSESLQSVPISITALGEQKLKDLNISSFKDYVAQLPSVTFQPGAGAGGNPGNEVIYMRGVAAGGDGNHSGPLPAVGVYLDEQPVTTIGGNVDVHIYDIARIESLAGPQGTLYGASSEAGTIRIITNKPEIGAWKASVDGEVNTVDHGGVGGQINGMINVPISDRAALRVVGWYERDAGYIDNVAGTRTFCGGVNFDESGNCVKDGISVNNAAYVKKNYNTAEIYGGRAALKIELDDNWTVTPQIMGQETKSKGFFAYDPSVGDLQVQHFLPEYREDHFIQGALTIEGKLSNWDVTYAGAYMDRKDYQSSDYTDYAEAYDRLYSTVGGEAGYYFYFHNAAGNNISAQQQVIGTDHFKKMSHELRVASPSTAPVRLVAGAFYQRQSNLIHQDYEVAGLDPALSVNGLPGTLWLTQQHRVDRDYAMFGEASWDIVPTVTLTAGVRGYMYDNTLIGFFGFGRDPGPLNDYDSGGPPNAAGSNRTGVAGCFTTAGDRLYNRDTNTYSASRVLLPAAVAGAPCTNLGVYAAGDGVVPVKASGSGATYKFNATWKPGAGLLFYGTVSRGFRPGGINRRNDIPAYAPDTLMNYEIGWKTTFLGGLVRINGAVYQQDWNHFQYAFLGANSFTEIHNGPNARIRGVELDAAVNAGPLNLSVNGAYTDARTRQNLCVFDDPSFACTKPSADGVANMIASPTGTRLPITPKWKLAGTARYTRPVGAASVYGQINATYQSSASSDIRDKAYETFTGAIISPADQLGRLAGFATVNLALGSHWDKFRVEAFVSNVFDERGQLARLDECGSCGQRPYIVPTTPRTIGLRVGADF